MESQRTWKDKLIGTLIGVRTVLVILLICSVPVSAIILMTFGAIAAFERMALVPAFMALGVLVLGMFIFSDTDRSGTSELKEFMLKTAFLSSHIGLLASYWLNRLLLRAQNHNANTRHRLRYIYRWISGPRSFRA